MNNPKYIMWISCPCPPPKEEMHRARKKILLYMETFREK